MKIHVCIIMTILSVLSVSLSACTDTTTTPTSQSPSPPTSTTATTGTTTTITGPIAHAITAGPDGNVWFTIPEEDRIGNISPETGAITWYDIPTPDASPWGITTGPDGNIWFAETYGNKIGRLSPETGKIEEFNVPTLDAGPVGITAGPDNRLWFVESFVDKIGSISITGGTITEYDMPSINAMAYDGITADANGNVWFTESQGNNIVKIAAATGEITAYPVPTPSDVNAGPYGICAGPDGRIWFTELNDNQLGVISPQTGEITEYDLPGEVVGPYGIAAGPDGNIWFTRSGNNEIANLDPATGKMTFYRIPTPNTGPYAITAGPDSCLWFTETYENSIGKIEPDTGKITEYPLARERDISYSGPLTLDITSPRDGKTTSWGFVKVEGSVLPASAVVEIENEGYTRVSMDGIFESDYILLDEGTNDIKVIAMTGREQVEKTVSIVYEPDLHISINPDYADGKDWLTEYPEARINGRVSDPRAAVTVNGQRAAVDNGGYFTVQLQLDEGMNTLTGTAVLGKLTATETMDVAYKQEPLLSVHLEQPWAGDKTSIDYIRVTGTVSDPEASIVIYSALSTGTFTSQNPPVYFSIARVTANGRFTGYARLSEGKNEVTITAHRGDDTSVASVTVEYQKPRINLSSTPDLVITSPVPGTMSRTNLVAVTGTVDEPDATVLIDGLEMMVGAEGGFTGYAVLENTGDNTIEVVAFNKSRKDVQEIHVAYEPPLVVTLEADTEPDTDYTREPMTVTGRVNKPEATVMVNGKSVTVTKEGWFTARVYLEEGSNTITAIATLGNEQDDKYLMYVVEDGQLGYVPGYSHFFSSTLRYEHDVTLKAGGTVRLPVTLETKKDGPDGVSGMLYYVQGEYDTMPASWPKGLDAWLEPEYFTGYPNTVYRFDAVIATEPDLAPGTYYLRYYYCFRGYGNGWIRVTVE